jgi:DNA-binding response OmpR family regulator
MIMAQKNILIVEDDPNLGRIYLAGLKSAGYIPILDANGDQFKQILAKTPPDLIILDIHVPFSWGPDTLQVLDSQEHTREIPRLIITADIFAAKTMQDAGETVMIKPVGIARLLEAVERLLASPAKNSSIH